MRDRSGMKWRVIARRIGAGYGTAIYLYSCAEDADATACGRRRAVLATLALAGPRVSEVCAPDNQDISLTRRRTYITYLLAAGYDLPYVQAQVGHVDPTTTLGIYAHVMARRDRDQLRAEIRTLLGADTNSSEPAPATTRLAGRSEQSVSQRRGGIKAPKGPTANR
jgi:hypothetical protein